MGVWLLVADGGIDVVQQSTADAVAAARLVRFTPWLNRFALDGRVKWEEKPQMRQEDVELNKARVQVVRSQLKEFSQTLQEIEPELSRPDLRRKINEHSMAIQLIRDKLSGVETFLGLLVPA